MDVWLYLLVIFFYYFGEAGHLVCIQVAVEVVRRLGPRRALVLKSRCGTTLDPLRRHGASLPEFDALVGLIVVRIADHLSHCHVHEVPGLQHHSLLHVVLLRLQRRVSLSIVVHAVAQRVPTHLESCIGRGINQVIIYHVVFMGQARRIRHDQVLVLLQGPWIQGQGIGPGLNVTVERCTYGQWVHQCLRQARHPEVVQPGHVLTQALISRSQIRTQFIWFIN